MKNLIRKILHETIYVESETSDLGDTLNQPKMEEGAELIKNNKKRIEKLIPNIVEYFKTEFGDKLVKIEIDEKEVHYGHENLSLQIPNIKFYFDFTELPNNKNWSELAKRTIYIDLKYFNIDIIDYGVPLNFEVYKKTWERV